MQAYMQENMRFSVLRFSWFQSNAERQETTVFSCASSLPWWWCSSHGTSEIVSVNVSSTSEGHETQQESFPKQWMWSATIVCIYFERQSVRRRRSVAGSNLGMACLQLLFSKTFFSYKQQMWMSDICFQTSRSLLRSKVLAYIFCMRVCWYYAVLNSVHGSVGIH